MIFIRVSLLFFVIFCVPSSIFAHSISKGIFKNLREHILNDENKKALDYLRKYSGELVGTDKLLLKYAQGVLAVEFGKYEEAEKEFDQAYGIKELGIYIEYYRAVIDYNQENFLKAEAHLKKALKEKKIQKSLLEKINYLYGRIDLKNKKGLSAYKKLNPLLHSWKGSLKRVDLLEELLSASIEKKLFGKRRYCKWFRDLYENHPLSKYSNEWGFKDQNLLFEGKKVECSLTLKNIRSKLKRYYLEGLNNEILKHLEEVKNNKYTYERLLSSYYYYIGKPHRSLTVIFEDKKIEENYDEKIRIAKVLYYAGQPEKSLFVYKDLYKKEKTSRKKANLLFNLANLNLELSNFKAAQRYFKSLLKNHRRSIYAKKTQWLLPWSMYLDKKYQEAYSGFVALGEKIKNNSKGSKYFDKKQVYYWAARSLEKLGQESNAVLIYKQLITDPLVSYYAILSALRLENVAKKNQTLLTTNNFLRLPWIDKKKSILIKRDLFLADFKPSIRMPSTLYVGAGLEDLPVVGLESSLPKNKVKDLPLKESTYSLYMQRYIYLSRLGFFNDANEELVVIKKLSKTKNLKEELLGLFQNTKDFSNLSRLASTSFYKERSFSKPEIAYKFWSKSYPKAYEEYVLKASSLFDISKNLVWSVMRAESFFDTKALSPVGARGLLQIMPYTGAKILSILSGKDPLLEKVTRDEQSYISKALLKPRVNIRYGAKYLSRLNKQFNGHLPFVVASYNAGPHRVKMWSKMVGQIHQDEFIERVPFKETKSYMKKVMRNIFVYTSLYGKGASMHYLIQPTAYVELEEAPTAEYWGKF